MKSLGTPSNESNVADNFVGVSKFLYCRVLCRVQLAHTQFQALKRGRNWVMVAAMCCTEISAGGGERVELKVS